MRRWMLLCCLLTSPVLAQPAPPQAAPPRPAAPAAPTAAADRATAAAAARKAALAQALDALKVAISDQEAAALETKIRLMWLNASTPAVTLLIGRGARELKAGAAEDAEGDFSAALTLDPDSIEAWHHLAQARFAAGDTRGAIAAISETLKREPRHFAALQTLSRFAEAREDWKGAYEAWAKAMEIAPKLEGGTEKLKDLKRRALGDDT